MHKKAAIATAELAKLLTSLAHRHRIQIIEELRPGEMDVTSLREQLGISASSASQHLRVLKAHHLVRERREGRHVYYHLVDEELALWLTQGLRFVESEIDIKDVEELHKAIVETRKKWLEECASQHDVD